MSTVIQKKSLADEVAERLQKQILSNKYKSGDKLPTEPQLMKLFGVGRSTIREAIKILSNLGFLSVRQGIGTFIETPKNNEFNNRNLKRADITEVDEVRKLFELKIAEKAALNRTNEDIKQINKFLLERKEAAKNNLLEQCIDADVNFHLAIAIASHNTILADLYKLVATHLKKGFKNNYTDTNHFIKTQQLHEQLAKYIILKDEKKSYSTALKIIAQH